MYEETVNTDTLLLDLSEIKLNRSWIMQSFKFWKLNLTKDLYWELVIDIFDDMDQINMDYNCVFVKDPSWYNRSLRWILNEFRSPQKSLDPDLYYIARANKLHKEYEEESKQMETIDFVTKVSKYETKAKTNQIKLFVSKDVAEFITNHIQDMKDSEWKSKYALIFLNNN